MHKQDELLSNIVENSKHSIDQRESVQDLNNKVNELSQSLSKNIATMHSNVKSISDSVVDFKSTTGSTKLEVQVETF